MLLSLSHFTSLCYLCVFHTLHSNVFAGSSIFSSLQRAKEEIGDRPPSYLDTGYAIGVVLLFLSKLGPDPSLSRLLISSFTPKVSAIASTLILPSRCYSGPNEHFKALGQVACNLLTVKAVFSWLGVLTSKSCLDPSKYPKVTIPSSAVIIGSITIFIASREVIEHAKLPPPVLSGDDSEAPGMRWVGRDDPFITIEERRYPNV